MMAINYQDDTVIKWLEALEEAGVIPPKVRRMIIDIPMEDAIKVYYECLGDPRMFTIDLVDVIRRADVIGVAEMEAI